MVTTPYEQAIISRPEQINEKHWEEWINSAVSPEIIERNVRTILDSREVDRVLNRNSRRAWKHSDHLVPCWEVTGLNPLGWERTLKGVQIKPDIPPMNSEGKSQKYIGATGHDCAPLFLETEEPDYWLDVQKNKSTPIILTEGAKKAGAGLSAGYATISIPGVSTCRKLGRLHEWLNIFAKFGRIIYLCFDNDVMQKKPVQNALIAMARDLAAEGSKVMVIELPEGTEKGMDDYLAKYGRDEFNRLVENAKTVEEWRKKLNEQYEREAVSGAIAKAERQQARSKHKQMMNLLNVHWGDRLRFNEMTQKVERDGEQIGLDCLYLDVAEDFDIDISKEMAVDIALRIAKKQSYSPVREYLTYINQEYPDIETGILETAAFRYFGTNDPLHAALLKRTLISAVARAFNPGCKVDTLCILQGNQGWMKSTFWKILAGQQWFTDNLTDASDKDQRLKLRRYWILEFSEFENAYKKKDVEELKAFLSCSVDSLRRPYGREIEDFPRSSIFVGSTNRSEFLYDPTGERRYWVIPVLKKIPLDQLKEERDQLWAAAIKLYQSGEQWWLTPEEESLLADANSDYQSRDTWEEAVMAYIKEKRFVTVADILNEAIKLELSRQGKAEQMRITDILRRNGWGKAPKQRRINGKQCWYWEPTSSDLKGGDGVVTEVVTEVVTPCETDKLTLLEVVSQPSPLLEQTFPSESTQVKTLLIQEPENFLQTEVVTPAIDHLKPVFSETFAPSQPSLSQPLEDKEGNPVSTPINECETAKTEEFECGDRVEFVGFGDLAESLRGQQMVVVGFDSKGAYIIELPNGARFPKILASELKRCDC